jgi:hypothetical protein
MLFLQMNIGDPDSAFLIFILSGISARHLSAGPETERKNDGSIVRTKNVFLLFCLPNLDILTCTN